MAKRTAAQRLTDLGNTLCPGCVVVLRSRDAVWARGWFLEAGHGSKTALGATEEEATKFLKNQIDFFKIDENVRSIEEDYGTDAFYLNHQDEVLRAAEGMGYDAVMMADPSSAGESWSCVVFSPTQVFILGRSSG